MVDSCRRIIFRQEWLCLISSGSESALHSQGECDASVESLLSLVAKYQLSGRVVLFWIHTSGRKVTIMVDEGIFRCCCAVTTGSRGKKGEPAARNNPGDIMARAIIEVKNKLCVGG